MKRLKFRLIIFGILLFGLASANEDCESEVTPTFASVITEYCSCSTIPALPTKSDNDIVGTWSPVINNRATTEYTFTPAEGECATTIKLTITINPTYTVTFNSNEGTDVVDQIVCINQIAIEPPAPTRNGYDFVGWYTDNGTFENKWNFETSIITQDTTLHAKWNCAIAPTEIIRKGDSNILICKEVPNGIYQWGFFEKGKAKDATFPNEEYAHCCPYYQFEIIDTMNFVYFVDIRYEGGVCTTRTYYSPQKNELQSPPNFKITTYPNPTTQHLSLTLEKDIQGSYTVLLLNTFGQTVFSKQYAEYRKNEELNFDFNLPAGLYLLAVETKEEVLTSKIVIE